MEAYDLTLLGFSPHAYPMVLEVAAAAWGRQPAALRVQVIHNLAIDLAPLKESMPADWPAPDAVAMADWAPSERDGALMPGVLREPAVSVVWSAFAKAKSLQLTQLSTLIHPTASVAPSATIGPGTWVQPNATIGTMSRIGACCHINRNASVGHHNTWGHFSRLNPGAHTAGFCQIGHRVTIGLGAVVRESIQIGDGAMVGAGSVVVKDVAAETTVVGIPAKPLSRS